jgi:2-oxoglutarate-Fe(II)-dependent oxygenase superfamily protein
MQLVAAELADPSQECTAGSAIDLCSLDAIADHVVAAHRHRYLTTPPFPHLVLDGLFPSTTLAKIECEFDRVEKSDWQTYSYALQTKQTSRPNTRLPLVTQDYFDKIYSGPFLRFLSRVTGIDDLLPDPGLTNGGMHQVNIGGRFDIHTDFRSHPVLGFDNRLVVMTYLNRDWRINYGGALELWRQDPPQCARVILPEFGRTVIMGESPAAAHGHPHPVDAPGGRPRRALVAYFYTNRREDGGVVDRTSTSYVRRPGRPLPGRLELLAQQILPPIVLQGLKSIRRR